MDLFEDLFGSSDSEGEREFLGFEVEGEHEGDEVVEDGFDEDDELDEARRVENLEWSREASLFDEPDFCPFFGPVNRPTSLSALGFFSLFFSLEVFQQIVEQTNLYAEQENANKEAKDPSWFDEHGRAKKLTVEELKAFLGVEMLMGIIPLPTMRCYWKEDDPRLYQHEIAKVFPRNRFLAILRYLHLNDNTNLPPRDDPTFKLYRVQPLLTLLKESYLIAFQQYFPVQQELAIDEAMIKYKGRLGFIQYMPNKPVKRGIKVFCLCDSRTGLLIRFDIYIGRQGNAVQKDLSKTVVLKLLEGFDGRNFRIYMDNWFSSIKLFLNLFDRGIRACGTLRADRKGFPPCLKDIKLSKQGDSAFAQSGDMVISVWRDKAKNKSVKVLSTMFQAEGEDTVTRRRKAADGTMEDIEINRPPNIASYSRFMGGVDLSDQNRSYYPVHARRNVKWWKYIFYFMLDVSIINAWVLMKKITGRNDPHFDFRLALSAELIGNFSARSKVGRPRAQPVRVNIEHQYVELLPGSKGKQCKNCQRKRKRERAANREGKRPRESRFGCEQCGVVLCKGDCWQQWHREAGPMEDA